ncbi:MAG: hypothetical protein AAF362_02360 [Pseudomonadota bacterium]
MPSFGKRNTHKPSSELEVGEIHAGKVEDADNLGVVSQNAFIYGQIAVFVGLLIFFAGSLIWPNTPHDLSALGGEIYLPQDFADSQEFTDPRMRPFNVDTDTRSIGVNYALPAMAVAGLFAMACGHWILAGLVCLFFMFPWTLIGVSPPATWYMIAILFVIGAIRLSVPKRSALIILLPMAAALAVPVAVMSNAKPVFPFGKSERAHYERIKFADLIANENEPAYIVDKAGKSVIRISSLARLPASGNRENAGKAYAQAQEQALRGDLSHALQSLAQARDFGFRANIHEQPRVQAILDHAAIKGHYGEEVRDRVRLRYYVQLAFAYVFSVVGIAIALSGPLANFLSSAIRDRAGRIRKLKAGLQQIASRGGPEAATTAPIYSIAADDGRDVIAEIELRIKRYQTAAIGLVSFSVLFFIAYGIYGLPDAASSGAFDQVSLSGRMPAVAEENAIPLHRHAIFDPISYAIYLPVLALLLLRRTKLALGVFLGAMIIASTGSFSFTRHSQQEARVSDFSPATVAMVQRRLAYPSDRGKLALATKDGVTRGTIIGGQTAAYTYAQFNYLWNRPAEASRALALIADPNAISGLVHVQRYAIMKEWVTANGHPIPDNIAKPRIPRSVDFQRKLGKWVLAAGAATTFLALLVFGLMMVAVSRRKRLSELVTERLRARA